MIKKSFVVLLAAFLSCTMHAQTAQQLLAEMPDTLVPVLTRNNRLDCIDFINNRMTAVVENALGGRSQLLELTVDHAKLKLTDVSGLELMRMSLTDTTYVVCVVHAYSAPATESEMAFYSTDWQPLAVEDFWSWPEAETCWLTSDTCDVTKVEKAKELLDVPMWEMRLLPKTHELELAVSLSGLSDEDRAQVKPYLCAPFRYGWRQGRWQRIL